ncbi:MAG TPA: hypothetical protein VG499_07875 [Actinomycetota bacterium]|nr:hypothetical protein [Actinomycetota bacterium]
MTRRRTAARLGIGFALVLAVSACGSGGQTAGPATPATTAEAACVKEENGTGCLTLAPERKRVDRAAPVFSRPTEIDNPLLPVSRVTQSLQLGTVDSEPFRAEVTLMPGTKAITWDGRQVPTRIHQYVAFSGGRILEVALDWYAQADDGSVWYFGEDVFNYEDGVVADTHGTWLAGRDGPPGMIMPASPSPGQIYRPENIPELVFEEVTVTSAGQRVPGPRGTVDGALVIRELHLDGATEEKTFAPGYGEFSAGGGGDLEAVALAVPVDAVGGAPPAELGTLADSARASFDAAGSRRWAAASTRVKAMGTAWEQVGAGDVPELLAEQLTAALDALAKAVGDRDPARARQAALRVEQAVLDLELRHRDPAAVDLDRLDLWARQLQVDAAAQDRGAVAGDVATLQVIWDRAGHSVAPAVAERVEAGLGSLRRAAGQEDLGAAATALPSLRDALSAVTPP